MKQQTDWFCRLLMRLGGRDNTASLCMSRCVTSITHADVAAMQDKDDEQASDDAYRAFLRSAVMAELPSMDRALPDLRALAASLWSKYLLYAQQAKVRGTPGKSSFGRTFTTTGHGPVKFVEL